MTIFAIKRGLDFEKYLVYIHLHACLTMFSQGDSSKFIAGKYEIRELFNFSVLRGAAAAPKKFVRTTRPSFKIRELKFMSAFTPKAKITCNDFLQFWTVKLLNFLRVAPAPALFIINKHLTKQI